MRIALILSTLAAGLLASSAAAVCPVDAKVLFSCNTVKDKRIEVCASGGAVTYSFGSAARAEMRLRVPQGQTTAWQWRGPVRWDFYAVDVPNGSTVYSVFWGSNTLGRVALQEGVESVEGI